ncbi:MAG TPA: hypothetical protein DHV62_07485 [Elusimicrobia bacterium]|jgi:formate hydrogenlyase subunit 3/multisubunit Na+/H+ antiporter MnhD subunit|nr:hypothetical protein [Elusimicrobiota bacterium]
MLIFSTVIIPIVGAILIGLIGERNRPLRNLVILITCLTNFVIVLWIAPSVLGGNFPSFTLVDLNLFALQFRVDNLSLLMGILVTFLWIFTEIYSFGYMSGEHAQTRYYFCLTLALSAEMGIIFSANLLSLYIFYEFLTIVVYPLVIHEQSTEAYHAGIVYLVYLLGGGIMVLFAILLTYLTTGGNITFTAGGIPELINKSRFILYLLSLLFIFGFGVKGCLMPFHAWLPQAMVAPTPISALLHAVAVVNAGVYGLIRVIYSVLGPGLFHQLYLTYGLGILATITTILSAIFALRQRQIKRLLAYSTANQLSFVILGAAAAHPIALMGALLHLLFHSIMKITMFYAVGAVIKQTGKTLIKEMSGLARQMPLSWGAFAIAAWGIVGIPPVAGWVSKVYLIQGYLNLRQPYFAIVFLISSILELGFLMRPLIYAYFKKGENLIPLTGLEFEVTTSKEKYFLEVPLSMLIPIIITAVLSLAFGLIGGAPYVLSQATVKEFFP